MVKVGEVYRFNHVDKLVTPRYQPNMLVIVCTEPNDGSEWLVVKRLNNSSQFSAMLSELSPLPCIMEGE